MIPIRSNLSEILFNISFKYFKLTIIVDYKSFLSFSFGLKTLENYSNCTLQGETRKIFFRWTFKTDPFDNYFLSYLLKAPRPYRKKRRKSCIFYIKFYFWFMEYSAAFSLYFSRFSFLSYLKILAFFEMLFLLFIYKRFFLCIEKTKPKY